MAKNSIGSGIDCYSPITATVAAQLAAEGHKFAGRYLVPKGYANRITAEEARILTDAGLLILCVYETAANRPKGGAETGRIDGGKALACAREIGMPTRGYIYFAVDYDTRDYDTVEAYLRAAQAAVGDYKIGVYGSFYVVEEMAARSACAGFWQCVAWSGGNVSEKAHAYQYAWDETAAGITVDLNYLYSSAGLWNLEDDNMDGKEIYEKLNEYLREQPCPDWAQAELQEAIDAGITDGTRPCELIPRYQAAIMAKRAAQK